MGRAGNRRRVQALFLEAEEPLGQPVEFGADLLDDRPLFGQLVLQFFDGLCLMRDRFLEPSDAFVVFAHGFPRQFVPVQALSLSYPHVGYRLRRRYIAFRSQTRKSRWTRPNELGRVDKPVIFGLPCPKFDAKLIPIGKKIDAWAAAIGAENRADLGNVGQYERYCH
jgi:hypothetical protein